MRKRMFLTAVGDYLDYATKLEAAVPELERWRALLKIRYGFQDSEPPLKNADATKARILAGLERLLTNAEKDDQLVFLFSGHGTHMDWAEQALVAYPSAGSNLRKAAITAADIFKLLVKAKPAEKADVTFIFESCYAGGVNLPADHVSLFIEPTVDLKLLSADFAARRSSAERTILKFSDLAVWQQFAPPRDREEVFASPVVLAAARDNETASQIEVGYDKRMAFSRAAIDRLYPYRDSFTELLKSINPVDAKQHAVAHGERLGEIFPGQPDQVASAILPAVAAAQSIRIRFIGLGCFIKHRGGGPTFGNRIVCPLDTIGTGENHHFAFIEIAEDDIEKPITGGMPYTPYQRGSLTVFRFTLTKHLVYVSDPVDPLAFDRAPCFEDHVPSLPIICPELTKPGDQCYLTAPLPDRFTAFFDVTGSVDCGTLHDDETPFELKYGGKETWRGTTPKSVLITIPFTSPLAVLQINGGDEDNSAQIWIKPQATLFAGNARERDITGDGQGNVPIEIFEIFYKLAEPFPRNPARPKTTSVPVDACSVTTFP